MLGQNNKTRPVKDVKSSDYLTLAIVHCYCSHFIMDIIHAILDITCTECTLLNQDISTYAFLRLFM